MPTERRPLLKTIGGIAGLTALTGCVSFGEDDSEPSADMRIWHEFTEAEEEDNQQFIADFEEETDHTVKLEGVGTLDEQLETAMPAGEGPETWAWAHDWVGRFAVREDPPFLYDASDDIDTDLDVFTGTAADAVQYDGGVYGLPFGSETVALFYNEDLVAEPPETLSEMVEVMQEYHNPADGQYGLSYPATDPYFASGFLQAFGGNMYDESTNEVTLDAEACVDGLEVMASSLFDYIPEDPGYEAQTPVFADGVAPFAINGPWELGNFSEEVDNIGVTTLPTVDGNHPRSFSGIQMWYFSANLADADEETLQATIDWAEWYATTQKVTQNNADNHGMIPVNTEHADQGDFSAEVEAFSNQVGHGTPTPTHPDMDSVWGPTGDALTRVFNGDQNPQAALEQAADTIRDSL